MQANRTGDFYDMIFLTNEERQKFSTYLKEQAESDMGILEQHKKLNETLKMSNALQDALSKKYENEIAARLIVASILDKTETWGG